MNFREFCKEKSRMCSNVECKDGSCKIYDAKGTAQNCNDFCIGNCEKAEQIVDQWAKEHPIVTNGMKFMEIFGETFCSNMLIGSANEWWHTEYQPPKGEEDGN